jgi:hypothetical protein
LRGHSVGERRLHRGEAEVSQRETILSPQRHRDTEEHQKKTGAREIAAVATWPRGEDTENRRDRSLAVAAL